MKIIEFSIITGCATLVRSEFTFLLCFRYLVDPSHLPMYKRLHLSNSEEGAMIQSIEAKFDHIPGRKIASPYKVVILLLISTATIFVSVYQE